MAFRKIISVFFIICTLFALSACNTEEVEVTTEAAAETEAPAVEKEEVLILAENGKTDFKIIRSQTASGYYLDTAAAVNKKMKEEISADFKITDDWLNPREPAPVGTHEILLFDTNREESIAAREELTSDCYIVRVTDCKIVIAGTTPAACNAALHCFFDEIVPQNTLEGKIALPIGLEVKGEFKPTDLDIAAALREGKTLCADFNILFNYPKQDGFTAAQGSATDGEFAYVVMKDSSGEREVDRIVKIDISTWEVVLESETLTLDHANDMTYDPATKQLIVTNMYNNLISIIDSETLALVEQKALPYGTYGTGYIDGSENYAFLGYGSVGGLVITDKNFNVIRSSPLASAPGYIGQGMDADAKFAYVPLSPDGGKSNNIIQIYDITTGEYLGVATVKTTKESESIFHVGDDFYIHFNSGGSTIATLEFYIRFE